MSSPEPWDDARARLTAWGAGEGIQLRWPNEPFMVPAATYVSVGMIGEVLSPIELGTNGGWSESGHIVASIHVPSGHGTRDARVIGKAIANLFRGLPPSPVVYRNASIGDGEPDDSDSAWWVLTVVIDYSFTDIVIQ